MKFSQLSLETRSGQRGTGPAVESDIGLVQPQSQSACLEGTNALSAPQIDVERLVSLFNQTFRESHRTVLCFGDDEPIYYPQNHPDARSSLAEIHFAYGYLSSALHEIAHWTLAGAQRRTLVDYGYWYAPDGRTPEQQQEFEKVEIKPQAIECCLARACGTKFEVSIDNLSGGGSRTMAAFRQAVMDQAAIYDAAGLPPRAERFKRVLLKDRLRQEGKNGL